MDLQVVARDEKTVCKSQCLGHALSSQKTQKSEP